MSAQVINGRYSWKMSTDEEGHRTYNLSVLVESDSVDDGPAVIEETSGLPTVGSTWVLGNDSDPWAFCLPNHNGPYLHEEKEGDGGAGLVWRIDYVFSSKPVSPDKRRCQDTRIEDPLLEPAKITGNNTRFQEEASYDRYGFLIMNSAWEQVRGPQVEFDRNRKTLIIEQNVGSVYLADLLPSAMLDKVNAYPIWGRLRRCVKLSSASFERKFYGVCSVYYTRRLEFEFNDDTFDRYILDEGSKVLKGRWNRSTGAYELELINGQAPNRFNPQHYTQFTDPNGNNIRGILDGYGLPAQSMVGTGGPYISRANANVGHAVTDETYWIRYVALTRPYWSATTAFVKGNIIFPDSTVGDDHWLCLINNTNSLPSNANPNWLRLPSIGISTEYSALHTYSVGDTVYDVLPTGIGRIFVQKYGEADFLQLGVPAVY